MHRRDFVTAAIGGAAGLGAGKWTSDRRWAPLLEREQTRSQELERHALPPDARMTFSQQGEDIVLFHVIQDLLRVDRATYIDVGAAEPVLSNNTYLLWGVGHRGVLVEKPADVEPALREAFQRKNELVFLDFVTDQTENVYPMIPGGKGITEIILSEDL